MLRVERKGGAWSGGAVGFLRAIWLDAALLLLFLSVVGRDLAAETSPTLAMSFSPTCTQCHLLWLEDFDKPDAEILVPYDREENFASGIKNAESSELMCYSCHDGYVADSRLRIRTGQQHPMAGISALGRKRPRQLPLMQEETVYCGTCHTPHGPAHESEPLDLETNAFLRMAERPGPVGLCVLCHDYATSAPDMGNHPVGDKRFTLPQELTQLHARSNGEQWGMGCQSCHLPHGAKNPALVLLGGADGSSATLCAACHKSDFSAQGIGLYSHPVGVRLASKDAGPRFPNGEEIYLSADGAMSCLSCHDMHMSRVGTDLLRFPQQNSSLCVACHPEPATTIAGTPHDLRLSAPDVRNRSGKTALEDGVCGACHMPHKARLPYLWSRPARGGQHLVDRLCLSCHSVGGIASTQIRRPAVHPTMIDKALIRVRADRSDLSLSVPVYDSQGRSAERGDITCLTCHDAHCWEPPRRAAKSVGQVANLSDVSDLSDLSDPSNPSDKSDVFAAPGSGNVLNSFLRQRSEDQICKHCHGVWGLWRYSFYHSPLRSKR